VEVYIKVTVSAVFRAMHRGTGTEVYIKVTVSAVFHAMHRGTGTEGYITVTVSAVFCVHRLVARGRSHRVTPWPAMVPGRGRSNNEKERVPPGGDSATLTDAGGCRKMISARQ
jgi:hypothetical protein